MALIRVLTVMQGTSGLPEDRYINTWHFFTLGPFSTHVIDCFSVINRFWSADPTVGDPLGAYVSPVVSRSAEMRAYNLSDPEPRVPTIEPLTFPSANDSNGLPEEVAAVISFHGDPPVTARRRGRLYIGPLTRNTITSGSTSTYSAFNATFTGVILNAADNALDESQTEGAGWSIRSVTPSENFVPVVGGWFDNAIDIQRRRGAAATVRSTWPTA